MSAGMSQSIALPAQALEALGEYKDALKATKKELKDLEKEAKRIEKQGGIITDEMRSRMSSARGRRDRLEAKMADQRAQQSARREFNQKSAGFRRAATDPSGFLADVAMRRMQKTRLGRAAGRAIGRGFTRLSSFASTSAGVAATALVAIPAGAMVGASAGYGVEQRRRQLALQKAQGDAQAQDAIGQIFDGAAIGGSAVANASRMINAVNFATAQAEAMGEKSLSGALGRWWNNGLSAQKNNVGTKAAVVEARRQAKIVQYGAAFGDYTDERNVVRRRGPQMREEYLAQRGSLVAEVATRWFGKGNDVVDPTAMLWEVFTAGAVDVKGATMQELALQWREKEAQNFEKERQALQKSWNTAIMYARERALANERSNAVQAYERDKLERGVTWRLQ